MSHALNQTRIKDITLTVDMGLNLKECNRNMQRFFDIADVHDFNLGFAMDSQTRIDFIHFLKDYMDGADTTYFHAEINARDSWIDCLFVITEGKNDIFRLNVIELKYAQELIKTLSLENCEYSTVLSSFDCFYFVHNFRKERIILKNTKNLGDLYEGSAKDFESYFAKTFGINLEDPATKQAYKALMIDMDDNISDKAYKFALNNEETMIVKGNELPEDSNLSVYTITMSQSNIYSKSSFAERYDGLTGLYNKRAINELAIQKIEKLKANCSIMIIDLDNFKDCNDNFGHAYGDKVLVNVAGIIKEAIRGVGSAGRIGGDEFLAVLDTTEEQKIREVARNIRLGIQWSIPAINPDMVVTGSFGIARYFGNDAGFDDIFALADKCLYIAKNKGRNCYVIYRPEIHDSIMVADRTSKNLVLNGQLYLDDSLMEEEIATLLFSRPEGYKSIVLTKTMAYLGVSRVILYDKDFNPVFHCGKMDQDVRCEYLKKDGYFKYFNSFDYFIMDNSNILDTVDKDKYEMYLNDNIGSSMEYLAKGKGLLCYDVFKPAKTFNKAKVSFLLMVSRMILND